MQRRYWDLSEKERSELTIEQVDSFLEFELMEQGVTKVDEPVLLPVDIAPVQTQLGYALKHTYSKSSVAYRTPEAAAAALKDAFWLEHQYIAGDYSDIDSGNAISVESIRYVTQADYLATKSQNDKAAANKKVNDKAQDDYKIAARAVENALSGVWEDYRDCQSKAYRLQRVVDTWKEYLRLCEDNVTTAAKFLAKAFKSDEITAACDWFGLEIPDANAPQPVAAAAPTEAETESAFA
jgi:mRNA-degrading endonuclease YafQ of YafQ-DinJ toxin-antitoxin module